MSSHVETTALYVDFLSWPQWWIFVWLQNNWRKCSRVFVEKQRKYCNFRSKSVWKDLEWRSSEVLCLYSWKQKRKSASISAVWWESWWWSSVIKSSYIFPRTQKCGWWACSIFRTFAFIITHPFQSFFIHYIFLIVFYFLLRLRINPW